METTPTAKPYKAYLAAVVVAIGIFAAGRYTAPVETVTKDVIVEKIDEKKVAELNEVIASLRSRVHELESETHSEEVVISKPDGTVISKKKKDTKTKESTKEVVVEYVDREVKVIETKFVDREVTKEKKVTAARPSWLITGVVGTSLSDLNLKTTPPYLSPVVGGLAVQHRLIGPLYGGGWVMSNKTVGLSLTLELP